MKIIKHLVIPFFLLVPSFLFGKIIYGYTADITTQNPIDNAIVILMDNSNQVIKFSITDSLGNFFFTGVENDTIQIKSYRFGYNEIIAGPYSISNMDEYQLKILHTALPIAGDSIVVESKTIYKSLVQDGFYDRKKIGFAKTVTRESILKRNPPDILSVLRSISGLQIKRNYVSPDTSDVGSYYSLDSQFYVCSSRRRSEPVVVYVDGIMYMAHDRLQDINPFDIAGVEFYPTTTAVPMEFVLPFQNSGVLLVWTMNREF